MDPNISQLNLASIIAYLITDGHVQVRLRNNRNKYDYFGLFSKDENQLRKFNNLVYKTFGVKGKIREWGKRKFGTSKGCIISNAKIVKYLVECGVPYGDKVISKFQIQDLILNGDNEIIKTFLKICFTCEGSIFYSKKYDRWIIHFTNHKEISIVDDGKKYLESFRELLKRFGVETSNVTINEKYIRPKDNKMICCLRFRINKKQSIINYGKYIGFDTKDKNSKLKQSMKWARN